ncbi:MAG: hypothetical protein K8R23_08655 [Chthoniobacter sp.]|nr:hypothetical protein [Chthoniobacter sp.]
MNINHLTIAGPYTHENLSIFLLHGADALDGQRFIPLDDALEQKCVTVHETGDVGQLEVENLSEHLDLYIQAGDVGKEAPQQEQSGKRQTGHGSRRLWGSYLARQFIRRSESPFTSRIKMRLFRGRGDEAGGFDLPGAVAERDGGMPGVVQASV